MIQKTVFRGAVDRDAQASEAPAEQCSGFSGPFRKLAVPDSLKADAGSLTMGMPDARNTCVRPFPKQGFDMKLLTALQEKFYAHEEVTDEERALARQWVNWFEENALKSLPLECCDPFRLICRTQQFAEAYWLYRCMKQGI